MIAAKRNIMNLSTLKSTLSNIDSVHFQLENGSKVPSHFHVTEIALMDKTFIDCGGTLRKEQKISLQLWSSVDFHHRLKPSKLIDIIDLSIDKLNLPDLEVEVEYQADTIGVYSLDFDGEKYILQSKHTDCLAKDNCGIPVQLATKAKEAVSNCCSGSSCC